MTNEKLRQ
jgi:ATP-dependent DNA helicase PIF1